MYQVREAHTSRESICNRQVKVLKLQISIQNDSPGFQDSMSICYIACVGNSCMGRAWIHISSGASMQFFNEILVYGFITPTEWRCLEQVLDSVIFS